MTATYQATAVVFVTDPEEEMGDVGQILGRLFGLTPAEARLGSLLLQGMRLCDAAELLELSKETVRSQVKSIFSKTGTHGQSDLIRLFMRSPAGLHIPTKTE